MNKKFRDPKSKASKAAKASSSKAPEGTATKPVKAKGKKARDWSELDGIHRGDDEGELEFVEGAPAEEAMVVALRRHTLLPLDDCLYALQSSIPHLTRSALHRCF